MEADQGHQRPDEDCEQEADGLNVNTELSKGRPKPSTSAFEAFGDYMHAKVQKLELRALVVQHGGKFCHYYMPNQVTHVIASNLSASKSRDLQYASPFTSSSSSSTSSACYVYTHASCLISHNCRNSPVVRPEWITDSIKIGALLPWRKYELKHRFNDSMPQERSDMKYFTSAPTNISTSVTSAVIKNTPPRAPRQAHTAASPDFVSKFYSSSRLHHLSTWKQELQKYTFRSSKPSSTNSLDSSQSIIIVAQLERPDLIDKPVAVSHGKSDGTGMQSSDIASCNYEARAYGVKNGMLAGRALELCPDLTLLPYDFEKYQVATGGLYETLVDFADALEAVSCDEAYLDISSRVQQTSSRAHENSRVSIFSDLKMKGKAGSLISPVEYAHCIAERVLKRTGLHCSIGIGPNTLIARVATKLAKPAGIFYLKGNRIQREIDRLPINSLPGVGWSLGKKFGDLVAEKRDQGDLMLDVDDDFVGDDADGEEKTADNASEKVKCGVIRQNFSLEEIQRAVGTKTGSMIYNSLRGISNKIVASESTVNYKRQSVSVEVNWGIRFDCEDKVNQFICNLWIELLSRLRKLNNSPGETSWPIQPRKITINIGFRHPDAPVENPYKFLGCGHCERVSRSCRLEGEKFDPDQAAAELGLMFWRSCKEEMQKRYARVEKNEDLRITMIIKDLRGLGIQLSDLKYPQQQQSGGFEQHQEVIDPFVKPLGGRRMNLKKLDEVMQKEYFKKRKVEDLYFDQDAMKMREPVELDVEMSVDNRLHLILKLIDNHQFTQVEQILSSDSQWLDDENVKAKARQYLQRELQW